MKGIDLFLSRSLDSIIRENLGNSAVRRIEKRLFEKYGLSLIESIVEFQKLDVVLREHFGAGADGIEEELFNNVCSFPKTDNKSKTKTSIQTKDWITLKDPTLVNTILEAFGDEDKKEILTLVSDKSKIVYDILEESGIPQTSGYRKINSLIKEGLLLVDGSIESEEGKKINKYRSIFNNIRINIERKGVSRYSNE